MSFTLCAFIGFQEKRAHLVFIIHPKAALLPLAVRQIQIGNQSLHAKA